MTPQEKAEKCQHLFNDDICNKNLRKFDNERMICPAGHITPVAQEKAEAYIAGIVQGDGEDLSGAQKGDLLVVMHNTPANMRMAKALLKGDVQKLVEAGKKLQEYLGSGNTNQRQEMFDMLQAALTPFQQK